MSNQGWQDGDMESENENKEAMKAGKKPGKIVNHGWTPMDTDTDAGKHTVNKEAKKAGRQEWNQGGSWKTWMERRVFTGSIGPRIEKTWSFYRLTTGFSRLEPALTRH